MSVTSSVNWIAVTDEYPDADATVLVSRGSDVDGDPVWLGFTDGKRWFDACTGSELGGRVYHWADLPMAPT